MHTLTPNNLLFGKHCCKSERGFFHHTLCYIHCTYVQYVYLILILYYNILFTYGKMVALIHELTHAVCICRCLPKYRVCLSDSSDCPQYECIDRPAACDKNSVEPACDTDGQVHPSLCHLQQSGKTLAYTGHCQVGYTTKREAAALRGLLSSS